MNTSSRRRGTVSASMPAGLTVIYDDRCELCRRCRTWLEGQPQLVPISFAAASDSAVRLWAGDWLPVGDELVVVADTGATWVGSDAFITCLWALRDHRKLSATLQAPGMSGLAKQAFHALSAGRGVVSGLIADDRPCGAGVCTS